MKPIGLLFFFSIMKTLCSGVKFSYFFSSSVFDCWVMGLCSPVKLRLLVHCQIVVMSSFSIIRNRIFLPSSICCHWFWCLFGLVWYFGLAVAGLIVFRGLSVSVQYGKCFM